MVFLAIGAVPFPTLTPWHFVLEPISSGCTYFNDHSAAFLPTHRHNVVGVAPFCTLASWRLVLKPFCTAQTCLDGNPEGVRLSEKVSPPITFYPSLLEGDLTVSLADDGAISSSTTASSMTMTSSQVTSGGVVWKMSEESSSWTMFPSVGLLYPGEK